MVGAPRTGADHTRSIESSLGRDRLEWILGPGALELRDAFQRSLRDRSLERQLQDDLRSVDGLAARYALARAWVESLTETEPQHHAAQSLVSSWSLNDPGQDAALLARIEQELVAWSLGTADPLRLRIEQGANAIEVPDAITVLPTVRASYTVFIFGFFR